MKKESLLPSVPTLLFILVLTVSEGLYCRGDISIPWIAVQVGICLVLGYAFEAFQRHQRKKYALEEGEESSSKEP